MPPSPPPQKLRTIRSGVAMTHLDERLTPELPVWGVVDVDARFQVGRAKYLQNYSTSSSPPTRRDSSSTAHQALLSMHEARCVTVEDRCYPITDARQANSSWGETRAGPSVIAVPSPTRATAANSPDCRYFSSNENARLVANGETVVLSGSTCPSPYSLGWT
jgi:hypothetical protein